MRTIILIILFSAICYSQHIRIAKWDNDSLYYKFCERYEECAEYDYFWIYNDNEQQGIILYLKDYEVFAALWEYFPEKTQALLKKRVRQEI